MWTVKLIENHSICLCMCMCMCMCVCCCNRLWDYLVFLVGTKFNVCLDGLETPSGSIQDPQSPKTLGRPMTELERLGKLRRFIHSLLTVGSRLMLIPCNMIFEVWYL